ncbi:RNA polymerase factor sigma-54 [Sphingomonas astaxanthinifaciens]|uniref:RNA polymerase sigma-54 factor n=1 Tax=Sphingomonas astaxanthinifaciens DSM 22298 TaxID=1123267 RepID=A0ABQ5Z713_9SPHN|nr:RNA polymerase factor sigma-54 [Sphingomonas astaxanthinifaciens]GLR46683.1 RNA polymerase sigma-54 factor [Sphingomonas astaxanthinifaciens DSM 22298]
MGLGPGLQLRASQSLVMSQQLQQAIKLLQLTNLEVEAAIAEELARNPLLEMGGDGDVVVREDVEYGDAPADPKGADELGGKGDEALDSDWRDAAGETDSGYEIGAPDDDGFDFDRLASCETGLCEHLMGQLRGSGGPVGRAAEAIVHELEETGWLTTPLKGIAEALDLPLRDVEAGLRLVQGLDPAGVGARDLAECLALQAKAADRYDPAMARLIANLDLLSRGQMAALKRICQVDDEDLADMIAELRAYDPKPGCRFAAEPATATEPDVLIRRTPSGFSVELNPATLPRVLVNRRYHSELKAAATDRPSKAWLSEQLQSASWLVRALDQRARTIVRIVSAVVAQQEAFFREGVTALRPLTMGRIAELVEMHESTVSRVAAGKTLLCEHGLFELRSFFASGVAAEDGEGASAEAVKAAIAKLVANETEVLSDDQLVDMLKEQGFVLARRTVAKYREAIGIGSSVQRRRQRAISGKAA